MMVNSAMPGRIAKNFRGSASVGAEDKTEEVAILSPSLPYQLMCLIRPNLTRKTATKARKTAQASSENRDAGFVAGCVLMVNFLCLAGCLAGLVNVGSKKKNPLTFG
jgi:hypothetical protein